MARRKKSGSGGVIGALVIGAIALLAAIPKEVWIGVGVLAVIGIAVYLYSQSKKAQDVIEEPPETFRSAPRSPEPAARTSRAPTASPARRYVEDDEPVSVGQPSVTPPTSLTSAPAPAASVSNFRVPAAPKGYGAGRWLPSGEAVSVAGLTIPGGMVYVGNSLRTPLGDNDPCLIDPSKTVAARAEYTERDMGYWPSYSEISPSARRAYLKWLAGGRQDPRADIGYVFLFFYGLERRAILDASKDEAAQADWPVIAEELQRLLSIYGEKSHSFRRYAGELLDWVSLASHPAKLYEKPVPTLPKTFEVPLYIRLALGQAAVDGAPVPAQLALAWAKLDPNIAPSARSSGTTASTSKTDACFAVLGMGACYSRAARSAGGLSTLSASLGSVRSVGRSSRRTSMTGFDYSSPRRATQGLGPRRWRLVTRHTSSVTTSCAAMVATWEGLSLMAVTGH